MITKERLEKLIKEEKDCYVIVTSLPVGCIHLNKRYEPRIEVKEDGYSLWVFTSNRFDFKDCIDDCELFETKEEAEWYLEFGNITRTETLKLPTWEEFCKMEDDKLFFYKGSTYILRNDVDEIKIIEQYYDDIYYKFNKPLTKENYIEACELCRKLFLGEEV